MRSAGVGEVSLNRYPLSRRGKVRDIFDAGDRFVFVATDRVSAFDVILPSLVPDKGRILTDISRFWFETTNRLCPNHVVAYDTTELDLEDLEVRQLQGRTMQVRKAHRIDVECVVRARLAGSGWAEYQRTGTLAEEPLPDGLSIGDQLPEPRFTPARKNDTGHDENVSRGEFAEMIGRDLAGRLEAISLDLFNLAATIASNAGFVLADTKFEFGFIDGEIALIDEVLTPDSSRYWNAGDIRPGCAPPGFDKQVIRDWLEESGWDKEPPAPTLPSDVIELALDRYASVRRRLLKTSSACLETGASER